MPKKKLDWEHVRSLLRYTTVEFLMLSVIVCIWVVCYSLTLDVKLPTDDVETLYGLLFAAASMAFFVISLLIGILAIFGWQSIKEVIFDRIELGIQNRLEDLSTEYRGQNLTALGFMMAELSLDPDSLKPLSEDRLEYAILYCRRAYEVLEKTLGPSRLLAMNNLAYYLTVRGRGSDIGLVLHLAKELRREGDRLGKSHFLLTYCGAILRYSNDSGEREEVRKLLENLLQENLPAKQKKEAQAYLASLSVGATTP
jgi:hypothetical protein